MPSLLMVVTEDWYFVSHRLALAVAAKNSGYDVSVATRIGKHRDQIEQAGIRIVPSGMARRGGNPLIEILALVKLYRKERPDIIHHVALKPVIFGSIAARITGVSCWVNAVAGLGWLFNSNSKLLRVFRPLISRVFARTMYSAKSIIIVQNPDDFNTLTHLGINPSHLKLIRGAGVDLEQFKPAKKTIGIPPVIMLAARILWDKGVGEFVKTAEHINSDGIKARFVIVGIPDDANPGSIPEKKLCEWDGNYGIEWWGHSDDMAKTYSNADIACLPSYYGEGLPKSLIEAAACGLPIVTTDMPGCREIVIDSKNGTLVPAKNVCALVSAIKTLIDDPKLIKKMGAQSRTYAQDEFGLDAVIKSTLNVYDSVLR